MRPFSIDRAVPVSLALVGACYNHRRQGDYSERQPHLTNRELSIAFQTDKRARDYIDLAKLVNQYAFDAVTVYCDAPYHPSYGPLLLMAPHIERARLGPAGIPPSRMHPLDIAAQTALLADLAKGGVYIGLVRGGWLADHGIRELDPPITAIRETVDIIRVLLAGESAHYDGRVFQIAEHVSAPYPLPTDEIPLQIGTWGKKLAELAGEVADEVKVGGSANADMIPLIADYIAAGEAKVGRQSGTVKIVIGAVSVVDEDREAARWVARKAVSLYMPIVSKLDPTLAIDPELMSRVEELVKAGDKDAAARLIPDDILNRFIFAGAPADIIKHCARLYDAGAHRVELGTPHAVTEAAIGIRLIGEQVIPALKEYLAP
ncbi:MAG: LLM class flavin-dependent oxidoreductase [Chloroflexota bacterium]|nr:LLM class flavin-dependent oxidoreductase [Chloroflexota bacterium]